MVSRVKRFLSSPKVRHPGDPLWETRRISLHGRYPASCRQVNLQGGNCRYRGLAALSAARSQEFQQVTGKLKLTAGEAGIAPYGEEWYRGMERRYDYGRGHSERAEQSSPFPFSSDICGRSRLGNCSEFPNGCFSARSPDVCAFPVFPLSPMRCFSTRSP